MSLELVLLAAAVVFTLVAITLHVIVVVHSFKRSMSWGLVSLFVPFASVVYAFTGLNLKYKLALAGTLLGSVLAAIAIWGAAGMIVFKSTFDKGEPAEQRAMKEYESKVKEIEQMDNIQIEIPADSQGKTSP